MSEMGENTDQPMMEANLSPPPPQPQPQPQPQMRTRKRTPKVPYTPESETKTTKKESETKTTKRNSKRSSVVRTAVDIWAVQCRECRKWRVIPTQEEYEEIRRKLTEEPFTCKRKQNITCNDSADLEYGSKRIWVIDKPNLPKTPAGFKRRVVLRKNLSRMDCFYVTPNGKKLRGPNEVAAFLGEHPEFKDASVADFSFRTPKIARDTIPENLAGKESSVLVD